MKSGAAFAHKKIISPLAETVWKSIGSNPCTGKRKKFCQTEGNTKAESPEKERAELTNSMNQMRESYQVTWDFADPNDGIERKVSPSKHLLLFSRAEDIWAALNDIVFERKKAAFSKRGDLQEIRAKQSTRGLVIDSPSQG